MQSRVKRMDGLIQGLLQYSRIGRKTTPVKTINVIDLINEAIDSLSPPPEFEIVVADNMPILTTEVLLLQLVEGQGGKIRVESQLGEGASFYFSWRK